MVSIQSGIHKYRKLAVPKEGVRPTLARLKKTIFDILQEEVENTHVLDLFSGSGALGLEALSRGASHITFVEKSPQVASCIKKNIAHLKEEARTQLYNTDVLIALPKLAARGKQFDIIFADPPYSKGLATLVIETLDKLPILVEGGSFFVEDRFKKDESLDFQLENLKLISKREIGDATLFHFKR